MTTAVELPQARASGVLLADVQLADRAIGLAIASLVPAVFWVIVAAGVGHAFGAMPSLTTLALIGTSIAAFLAVVVGSIMAR